MTEFNFEAMIYETPENEGAYIIFPWNIKTLFGKGRIKVNATFDHMPYQGSIVNMRIKDKDGNICYIIGVLKQIRTQLNKHHGDTIQVHITIPNFEN